MSNKLAYEAGRKGCKVIFVRTVMQIANHRKEISSLNNAAS